LSKLKLFLLSLGLTTVSWLAIYYHRHLADLPSKLPTLTPVVNRIYITAQLRPENVPALRKRGFRTIVDIRPDGEAMDQPPSAEIAVAARENRIRFHYIPVPHETIPEEAVQNLQSVLSQSTDSTVLYCRTGRRAVRLFALAEASLQDGPGTEAILAIVRQAGFSAEDLKEDIARRISHRGDIVTVPH